MTLLGAFIWDPSPYLFSAKLPLIDRPLMWYGLLFALGFLAGYRILLLLARRQYNKEILLLHPSFQGNSDRFVEKLSFFVIAGGLIGARLGDLLFYQDLSTLFKNPLMLISFWEGGLSSHGGSMGILLAIVFFAKRYQFPFWRMIDLIAMPITAAAIFIRIGNFFNQEILGTPTTLPWGVLFLHPADGSSLVPRHAAQLYEAAAYLAIFWILYWKKDLLKTAGKMAGLFILLVFTTRFCIEFVKMEQSVYLDANALLNMGQYLSIPFILLGAFLYKTSAARAAKSDLSVLSKKT